MFPTDIIHTKLDVCLLLHGRTDDTGEQTTNSLSLRNLGHLHYQVCIVKVLIGGAPIEVVDDKGFNH